MKLPMHENCDFVVPVNILTLFSWALILAKAKIVQFVHIVTNYSAAIKLVRIYQAKRSSLWYKCYVSHCLCRLIAHCR